MGALPKRKISKARKNIRRSHTKVAKLPNLVECNQCSSRKLPHAACPNCGTYNGREAIPVKEPKKKPQ